MSDSEGSESSDQEARFAAVRFFCEENKKIHYVSIKDIDNFEVNDYSKPKRVKYGIDINGDHITEPAQILAVAGN